MKTWAGKAPLQTFGEQAKTIKSGILGIESTARTKVHSHVAKLLDKILEVILQIAKALCASEESSPATSGSNIKSESSQEREEFEQAIGLENIA
jgi:hypothetical protein